MRQALLMLMLVMVSLLSFGGYCLVLIDWVQMYRLGEQEYNWPKAILEMAALIAYTYLAVRFMKTKIFLP